MGSVAIGETEAIAELLARSNVSDLTDAARLVGMSDDEMAQFLVTHRDLIAITEQRARASGEQLPAKAVRVLDLCLDRAREILSHPEGCDPPEIKALAAIARGVLDDQTRRELAQQAVKDTRVVVDIVFENGTIVSASSPVIEVMADMTTVAAVTNDSNRPRIAQASGTEGSDFEVIRSGGDHE